MIGVSMRILIADEDIIVRKKIRTILEKLGYFITDEAHNGLHVYHKYVEKQPDLLFMNLSMPLYDGLSAVKRIKEYDNQAKIIVMMENKDNQRIFEALENGAMHYLVYPVDLDSVNQVIKDIDDILE